MRSTIVIFALFTTLVAIIYVWISYDDIIHDIDQLNKISTTESIQKPAKQNQTLPSEIAKQSVDSKPSSLNPTQIKKVESYLNEIEQSSTIKQQLAQLDNVDEEDKKQRADRLLYSVNEMFSAKRINSAEYVFLKLAIMRKVLPDEKFEQYAQNEIERQQSINAQAMNNYLSNRDPQFLEYKAREKALVEEILAMESFPNNMSRNEYLTIRIEALKKEVYGL